MHVFFGRMSAAFIGWADSPFQFEVGTASLGYAAVGLLAAFRSYDLRLAAVLGPSIFTLGAAVGHIVQMVSAHNFAPGNAGIIFWTDIFIRCSDLRCYGCNAATRAETQSQFRSRPNRHKAILEKRRMKMIEGVTRRHFHQFLAAGATAAGSWSRYQAGDGSGDSRHHLDLR